MRRPLLRIARHCSLVLAMALVSSVARADDLKPCVTTDVTTKHGNPPETGQTAWAAGSSLDGWTSPPPFLVSQAIPAFAAAHGAARQPTPAQMALHRISATTNLTITNVILKINGFPMDIGNITVSLGVRPDSVMSANFAVDPAVSWICPCVDFHWLQIITADDCPAQIAGVNATMPVVDSPRDGWDYMYSDGAARTKPILTNPNFGWFIDALPWYYGSTGEATQSNICVSYSMSDVPAPCDVPPGGNTTFYTYLVAQPKGSANFMCLVYGYRWLVSTAGNVGPTDLGAPTVGDKVQVENSLTGGNFPGWTVAIGCDFPCFNVPPPAGLPAVSPLGLFGMNTVLMLVAYQIIRRRRRAS